MMLAEWRGQVGQGTTIVVIPASDENGVLEETVG